MCSVAREHHPAAAISIGDRRRLLPRLRADEVYLQIRDPDGFPYEPDTSIRREQLVRFATASTIDELKAPATTIIERVQEPLELRSSQEANVELAPRDQRLEVRFEQDVHVVTRDSELFASDAEPLPVFPWTPSAATT